MYSTGTLLLLFLGLTEVKLGDTNCLFMLEDPSKTSQYTKLTRLED